MAGSSETPHGGTFDPATGAVVLDDWGIVLSPSLTRAAFLASRLGKAAAGIFADEPYGAYRLDNCRIDGRTFLLHVSFSGEAIESVTLSLMDIGSRDDDDEMVGWQPKREERRERETWRWLNRQLEGVRVGLYQTDPHSRYLPWGTVWAGWHPKFGDNDPAQIVICYYPPSAR